MRQQRLLDQVVAGRRHRERCDHVPRPPQPEVCGMFPRRPQEHLLPQVHAVGNTSDRNERTRVQHAADPPLGMHHGARQQNRNQRREPHAGDQRVVHHAADGDRGSSNPRDESELAREAKPLAFVVEQKRCDATPQQRVETQVRAEVRLHVEERARAGLRFEHAPRTDRDRDPNRRRLSPLQAAQHQ